MPVIYRHSIPSTSAIPNRTTTRNNSNPPSLVPTNADDSIVLSDLVRTGEASRLRRRGAMRLDHGAVPQAQPRDESDGAAPVAIASPTWRSEPDPSPYDGPVFARNAEGERVLRYGYLIGGARGRSRNDIYEDGEELPYTLFCGGEDAEWDEEADLQQSSSPYEPSVLPLYPPQASSSGRRPSYRKTKRTNGCGALLHMQASPRRRLGVWTAKSESSSGAVVGLDPSYFDRAAVAKIVRSACGCVREGVGCAVCGNPLGTRYKPCKAAAESIFSSRARPQSSQSFRPDGPQYWHAQSNARTRAAPSTPSHSHSSHSSTHNPTSSSSPFYVYTFFSTNVQSSPAFSFPPRPALTPHVIPTVPQFQPQSQSQLRYQYQSQPRTYQYLAPQAMSYGSIASLVPITNDRDESMSINENAPTPPAAGNPEMSFTSPTQPPDPPIFTYEAETNTDANTPTFNSMFDRVLTASPMPLSDVEEREAETEASGGAYGWYRPSEGDPDAYVSEGEGYGEDGSANGAGGAVGVRFDADGEFIVEPSSPDKTGEVMLFPER